MTTHATDLPPDVIEQNRRSWNETAAIHDRLRMEALLQAVQQPGFSTLKPVEREIFAGLGIHRRDIAQLSCNNARELLSLKLAGAGRCTGFDISDAFIEQGRRLAQAAGAELELWRGSVYDIPSQFDASYDIVYVTVGALGWLPALPPYFAVVNRLLRPGGALFIYEMHPVLDMFESETGLTLRHSYFRRDPYVSSNEPDYFDPSQRVQATSYWFHHPLGDIIGGALGAGLRLEHFAERPEDVSTVFAHLAREPVTPPMSYTLVARKPAASP